MRALLAVIAILTLTVWQGDSARAAAGQHRASQPKPTLAVVHVAGYQLAVAGRGWGGGSRVAVSVRSGGVTRQTTLQATAQGSFRVGITGLNGCDAIAVSATDEAGRSRSVRPRGLPCTRAAPLPVLRVLKGQVLPVNTTGAWRTYTSKRDGFAVEYPSSWTVQEGPAANGRAVTTFTGDGGGFAVSVFPSVPPGSGDETRVGNVYCHQITVAGLPAQQCLDTIAFARSTPLSSGGKTYVISAGMRRTDPTIYEHALSTFRLLG